MAKHASHILDMARKGAEHKYEELKAEIAALVKNFPHLVRQTRGMVSRGAAAVSMGGKPAVGAGITPRKRRKMSAKARKAISNAQKARWAKTKAETNKR